MTQRLNGRGCGRSPERAWALRAQPNKAMRGVGGDGAGQAAGAVGGGHGEAMAGAGRAGRGLWRGGRAEERWGPAPSAVRRGCGGAGGRRRGDGVQGPASPEGEEAGVEAIRWRAGDDVQGTAHGLGRRDEARA